MKTSSLSPFLPFSLYLFLLAIILLVKSGEASIGYTVSPERVEKTILGFKEITEVFEVANASEDSVRIKVEFEDFFLDENGKVHFLSAESLPNSIARYSVINPEELYLTVRGKDYVRVTFRPPAPESSAGAEVAEYYGMLVFKSLPIPVSSKPYQPTIQVASEIGVPIYYSLANFTVKEGSFESLYVENDSVRVVFKNTGNVHLRVTGEAKILTPDERVVEQNSIPEFVVFPERVRRVKLPIKKKLASGDYIVRVSLDYGGVELMEGERRFGVERKER